MVLAGYAHTYIHATTVKKDYGFKIKQAGISGKAWWEGKGEM